MLEMVLQKQRSKKYITYNALIFLVFFVLYTIIDSLNLSYKEMVTEYGFYLPMINILINIIMALLSALMMTFSSALFTLSGKEGKGSNLSFLSILFGILTYGCTPCVVALFSAIGITFTVAVLPLAGLPYKLISLLLVILGMLWVLYEIKHIKCKIKN